MPWACSRWQDFSSHTSRYTTCVLARITNLNGRQVHATDTVALCVRMPPPQYIPMATVAALLMYVATRMINRDDLLHMWQLDKVRKSLGLHAKKCDALAQ